MSNPELVLTVPRLALTSQGIGADGIYPFQLGLLNHIKPEFHDRNLIDNKTDEMVEFGLKNPQLISYFVLRDCHEKIFAYRRKGKEKGLFGKWSIGVGGHIDKADMIHSSDTVAVIANLSFNRELKEEVNLQKRDVLTPPRLIATLADKTSMVHVGYTQALLVEPKELVYEPAEFNQVMWMTKSEMVEFAKENEFETWSQMLINEFNLRGKSKPCTHVDESPFAKNL